MKTLDIHDLIDQAAGIFNFDWKQTKNQVRPTGQDKILRDMLMQLLWEQGAFKNEEIGNAMDISYSGVSKSVSAIKKQIQKDNRLKKSTNRFIHNSRCDPVYSVYSETLAVKGLLISIHDSIIKIGPKDDQGHNYQMFQIIVMMISR